MFSAITVGSRRRSRIGLHRAHGVARLLHRRGQRGPGQAAQRLDAAALVAQLLRELHPLAGVAGPAAEVPALLMRMSMRP